MTSTDCFWKENEAFFRTSFRDNETVLYIEELADNRLSDLLGTVFIYAILAVIMFIAPTAIVILMCFITMYLTACIFIRIAAGAMRRCFFVLTTHSVYYCKGFRGSVIFEWPCDSLRFIIGEKRILSLLSSEKPGDANLAFTGGIPQKGVSKFCKNIVFRITKKPLLSAIYSASNLGQCKTVEGKRYSMIEIRIKPTSALFDELNKIQDTYPQIEFKQVKLKPIKEVWPF